MAEKRFIHRRFLESEKIRQLANEGKERACFYYGAFLAHFDREGRMNANPLLLKGSLLEGYTVTVEEIGDALFDLARVGLVILYENGRHSWLIQCTKFLVEDGGFNRPHPKEPPSTLPGPDDAGSELRVIPPPGPEGSGKVPGSVRGEVEVYGKGKGKGKVKEELSSASPTRADNHQGLADIWNCNRGVLPECEVINDTRARGFDRLLKDFGDGAFARFAAATQHVAADPYWQQQGYNIDNLLKPGRVLEKSEKHTANRGMSAGDRKLATTAATIARAIGGLDA
jgi:hypothetical protein